MSRLGVLCVLALGCGPNAGGHCDTFVDDLTTCFDGYCDGDGADTAFCGCWDKSETLDVFTCQCLPLDETRVCEGRDLSDYEAGDGNCSNATEGIESLCAE